MNKHYRDVLVRQYCRSEHSDRKTIVVFSRFHRFVRWTSDLEVEPIQ